MSRPRQLLRRCVLQGPRLLRSTGGWVDEWPGRSWPALTWGRRVWQERAGALGAVHGVLTEFLPDSREPDFSRCLSPLWIAAPRRAAPQRTRAAAARQQRVLASRQTSHPVLAGLRPGSAFPLRPGFRCRVAEKAVCRGRTSAIRAGVARRRCILVRRWRRCPRCRWRTTGRRTGHSQDEARCDRQHYPDQAERDEYAAPEVQTLEE